VTNIKAYSIDFGTSNSIMHAIFTDGKIEAIPLDNGNVIMKSLSYYLDEDTFYFGSDAASEYENNSFEGRFIRSVKKFLPNPNFRSTTIGNKHFLLESIIGFFLKEMKDRADQYYQQNCDSLMLGRPAKYDLDIELDTLAQNRMHKAAMIAGFKNIHFYPEPLAAALEFPRDIDWQHLFVVDLGAGTSDFTWVEKQATEKYEVHALNSIFIAGDVFDGDIMENALAKYFAADIEYKLPLSSNSLTMPREIKYRLRSPADICFMTKNNIKDFLFEIKNTQIESESAIYLENLEILLEDNLAFNVYQSIERSKILLSKNEAHDFHYQYPGIDIKQKLVPKEFTEWTKPSVKKIISCMQETLNMANMTSDKIDLVLLTGGSSQVPQVYEALVKEFGSDKFYRPENFLSVARGLAKRANQVL